MAIITIGNLRAMEEEKDPLISIITVTFNAATVIRPTLESLASQTFRDFEHIVIDGASSDDTLALVRQYGSARILSEPDKGLYYAMNKGLEMARGRYVLFLNAGDAFHTERTLAAYAVRAREDDDIIFGDTVIVNSDRHIVGKRHLTAPHTLTRDSFAKGMLICHQAFMVKRGIAPRFDTSYRFSADYDWTIRCIEAADLSRCTNLHLIAIDYLAAGMTDSNKLRSLRERYRIMCRHYGKLPTAIRHIGFIFRALGRRFS